MIIKEFRIVIPMSVDEYQIGQLYTIQKKSRLESTGAGSGVEIIENKPYESKNEKGQYTLKVYHVDERLPSALKTISKLLFPKSALLFEEESWNCYPYTRTKYKHKLFKSFNIDIESKYQADFGQSDNVFKLSKSELSSRTVDYIDIVNDTINQNEYKAEEDPLLFQSSKTQRGPLSSNWLEELKANAVPGSGYSQINNRRVIYMCAYKLCRIECAFWGCQSRVEKLISDSVLRHTILMSHRQAWCWQDEYCDLTIDDVRQLELETQRYLNMKMRNQYESLTDVSNVNKKDKSQIKHENSSSTIISGKQSNNQDSISIKLESTSSSSSASINKTSEIERKNDTDSSAVLKQGSGSTDYDDFGTSNSKREDSPDYASTDTNTNSQFSDIYDEDEEDDEEDDDDDNVSQNSNFEEFYDAISQISFNASLNTNESDANKSSSLNSLNVPNRNGKNKANSNKHLIMKKLREQRKLTEDETSNSSTPSPKKVNFNSNVSTVPPTTPSEFKYESNEENKNSMKMSKSDEKIDSKLKTNTGIYPSLSITESSSNGTKNMRNSSNNNSFKNNSNPSKITTLVLVVHGGNVTCTDTSKQSDFLNFKSTMETVIKENYGSSYGHIAYRLVCCESICREALMRLAALSPVANEQNLSWSESDDFAESSASVFALHDNLPFSTLPLLALANQSQYRNYLLKFTRECNKVYQEFLSSNEGQSFQGQIVIVGDSLGSLLVYDSICQPNTNGSGDENSSYHAPSSNTSSQVNFNQQSVTTPSTPVTVKHMTVPNKTQSSCTSPITPRKETLNPSISINEVDSNSDDKSHLQIRRNNSGISNSSGIEFTATPYLTPASSNTHASQFLNSASLSFDERLDFDVNHFFVFGSPLGLVLAYRKLANNYVELPCCSQLYNLFHLTDPIAVRIEPLLCKQFRHIEPCMIPRYSKFPMGDGSNLSLDHFIVKHGHLFETNNLLANQNQVVPNVGQTLGVNDFASAYLTPNFDQLRSLQKIIQTKKVWWGENRIDYVLYAPEKICNLPRKSLPYIFHSCFWESTDACSFILRMIHKFESFQSNAPDVTISKKQKEPAEKWQRRLNRVKLRNLSANHRANDVIVLEDKEQILQAKFSYGPFDFALSGEIVDIYIMTKSSSNGGEWKFYASEFTDNHGKLKYELSKDKRLPLGMYQIRMTVKCDHTYVEFYMCVMPNNTEAVVFSIDGSFAANISFSGTDPKVRAGAVDVVRHWQDLGYLIIYITARPDIQHYKVTNWLAQHNFPLGMVYFSDGLSRDPIKQKTETLRNIVLNNNLKLQAAYGSSKDIPMYSSLGVTSDRIFIIGKTKSKYSSQAMNLRDGYTSHLSVLQNPNTGSRQATGNARLILKKVSFGMRHNTPFSNNSNTLNNTSHTNSNQNNNHSINYSAENSSTFTNNASPLNRTFSQTHANSNHNSAIY